MVLIHSLGGVPRVLADDIMLIASGTYHLSIFTNGLESTRAYLQDMGARIATAKS